MTGVDLFAIYLACGLIVGIGFHRIGQHEDPNDLLAHWSMIPFFALAWPFIVVLITGGAVVQAQDRIATGHRRMRKIRKATAQLESSAAGLERFVSKWGKSPGSHAQKTDEKTEQRAENANSAVIADDYKGA